MNAGISGDAGFKIQPPRGLRDSSDDDARPMLSNAAAELDDVKRAW